ncbi:MAG: transketolase C-terminal domain-containing protein [Dehalococcoidales bacterium]|nr:transketolase C-terminal domain-containing protein [Dehalococcoidales bacterium]
MTRKITYVRAINEALHQILESDPKALLIGQGVTSPWYVGASTLGLIQKFGPERVIDTPVSENCTMGAAVGAALAGMHPIFVFPRMDFMYYALDQLANHAANWHYMFGRQLGVPLVVWTIINRGGEQAAQHSQALQALFAHIPGLKVVMPGTAYDAKGLLHASHQDGNPVIYIDERWLYQNEDDVPEEPYTVPIGKGVVREKGSDVTLAANSYMALKAIEAAKALAQDGISVEVIDLRSIKPLDETMLLKSIKKTGRLVIADGGWKSFGVSAELAALAAEEAFNHLKAPVLRIALPDTPAPASRTLEKTYYPDANRIASEIKAWLHKEPK